MRGDEHREHAVGLPRLDEPHSPHVGCQVVDPARAGNRVPAHVGGSEVEHEVLGLVEALEPLSTGL